MKEILSERKNRNESILIKMGASLSKDLLYENRASDVGFQLKRKTLHKLIHMNR